MFAVSSISRVLRGRFGKKDDEDDCDKRDEDGEKKSKHSIDGILGDKGRPDESAQLDSGAREQLQVGCCLRCELYKLGLNERFVARGVRPQTPSSFIIYEERGSRGAA